MKRIFSLIVLVVLLAGCARGELADGQYTAEVTLSGGSGRAGIQSPASVTIDGGTATATICWSSPFYEYMLVDGVRYAPIQTQGNATFRIPISFDQDLQVQASTIAMSQPHLVDYTLRFDSRTLKGA